jgi:hypothetical protein
MKKLLSILAGLILMINVTYSQNSWTWVSYLPAPTPSINSISVVDASIIWIAAAAAGGSARIYRTVDGGANWQIKNTGLPTTMNGYGICALDSLTCWIGNDIMTIYKTSDGGNSWVAQLTVTGSFCDGIRMINANTGWFYADPTNSAGQPYQIRYTYNGGTNWVINSTSPVSTSDWGVMNAWDWSDTSHIWFGSANITPSSTTAKVFRTSTGITGTISTTTVPGTSGATGCSYQAVGFVDNNNGMIGSSGGDIKKTTDGGATYTSVTPPSGLTSFSVMNMCALKDGSNKIRLAIDSSGGAVLYSTTNLGTTWVREVIPTQASASTISHIQFLNANLGFAALGSPSGALGGLMKYGPLSGITGNNHEVPADYKLEQNYPNPFNPSTTIRFAIPKSGNVTLIVYNSIGKEVATLVSESMAAGSYTVSYDASALTSGLYFYKITTNGFTDTKKMLFVK